jgi:hypothetical protein
MSYVCWLVLKTSEINKKWPNTYKHSEMTQMLLLSYVINIISIKVVYFVEPAALEMRKPPLILLLLEEWTVYRDRGKESDWLLLKQTPVLFSSRLPGFEGASLVGRSLLIGSMCLGGKGWIVSFWRYDYCCIIFSYLAHVSRVPNVYIVKTKWKSWHWDEEYVSKHG